MDDESLLRPIVELYRQALGAKDDRARPRHPKRTVMYRVFAQHFERFVQVYEERFAPSRGPLPPGAQDAVNRYLDCGIFDCGFARVRCSVCGHDYFVAFSCKHGTGKIREKQFTIRYHPLKEAHEIRLDGSRSKSRGREVTR